MKKNKIKSLLYDSSNEITLTDYHEYLLDNDIEESELSFEKYTSFMLEQEYEDFIDNIKYSRYNKHKCVILGEVGRWNGRREIRPCIEENLLSAIKRCMNVRGAYNVKVEQSGNEILVTISHHDGIDNFVIHLLNKRGEVATENADLSKPCYHKAIKGYIF